MKDGKRIAKALGEKLKWTGTKAVGATKTLGKSVVGKIEAKAQERAETSKKYKAVYKEAYEKEYLIELKKKAKAEAKGKFKKKSFSLFPSTKKTKKR